MRELFIQCDNCGERVKSGSIQENRFHTVVVEITVNNVRSAQVHGDLCTECLSEVVRSVQVQLGKVRKMGE